MRHLVALLILTFAVPAAATPYESGGTVDEFIGAYTESVPIMVPAYHGIEPKLSLQYHSGRGNGYVGVGFALQGLSVIERREMGIIPQWKNQYFLDGQLLLPCNQQDTLSPSCEATVGRLPQTWGWFSTQSETYLRIERGLDSDNLETFVVTKPNGTAHYYKPAGLTGRYLLAKVIDTTGNNVVTYQWGSTFANTPSRISYNGTTISFYYEPRTREEYIADHGRLERLVGQLKTIDICVDPNPASTLPCNTSAQLEPRRARAYALTYKDSASTARPLLTSVETYGKDALVSLNKVISGTHTPAIQFAWTDRSPSYKASDKGLIENWGSNTRGMVDFDGDGKTDFCRDTSDAKSNLSCALSKGSTFVDRALGYINDWGFDDTRSWTDWNGDGKTDFCRLTCNDNGGGSCEPGEDENNVILCALSNGTSITDFQIGGPLPDGEQGKEGERWFVDWNGDGRGDYCRVVQWGSGWQAQFVMTCALSTGSGYVDTAVGELSDPTAGGSMASAMGHPETRAMVDWNGDGRTDFCRVVDFNGGEYMQCLFGRINEFDRTAAPLAFNDDMLIGQIFDRGSGDTQWYVDVNGDGSSDYCRLIGTADIFCAISKQTTLLDVWWATSGTKFGSAQSRRWGDVDGDRKMDMCFDGPGAVKECVISQGLSGQIPPGLGVTITSFSDQHWLADWDGDGRSEYCMTTGYFKGSGSKLTCIHRDRDSLLDLMSTMWNGVGGGTAVTYAPATKFPSARIRLPVVESFTRNGGAEGSVTQTFSYSGGQYDAFSRRFLGFTTVRITDPCLATETAPWQCPYTEITSRLGWRWPAAPSRISRYGGYPAAELSRQDLTYADTTTRPYRSDLIGDMRTQYEGTVLTTNRTFVHDKYGNATTLTDHGVVGDPADDRTLTTTFAYDLTKYIVEKPARIVGSDPQGMLTDVQYTYDARGFPTQARVWLDTTSTYLTSSMTYDDWGNLTSETDRNGAKTSYEYDARHQYRTRTVLPLAGTPAVSQAMTTSWDLQCGEKSQDWQENNVAVTNFEYDALCRRIRTELVGGSWETVSYHEVQFPNLLRYTETRSEGPTASAYWLSDIWKRTFYDGMGRVVKVTRNPAYTGGPEIIEQEITYDKRGNVATFTKPRYATDPAYTYTFTYDLRDRETSAILPSTYLEPGDTKITTHSMLTAITRDGMGHSERITYDARGRRVTTGSTDGSFSPHDLTQYFYDRRGNLSRIEQPTQNGSATAFTSYVWDSLGRKISSSESNGGTRTYDYDPKGNLISETDPNGIRTRFTYDALGRRTSKTVQCKSCTDLIRSSWRYDEPRAGYDNYGNMTSATDASGVATYNYDFRGNLVQGGRTVNGAGPFTFTKHYDSSGRLLATDYPDGTHVGTISIPIRYDEAGRVASIPGVIEKATYDASGTLTYYKAANGAEATYDTANPRGQIAGYTFEGRTATGNAGIVGEYEMTNTNSASTYTEFALPNVKRGDRITVSTCGASLQGASGTGDTFLRLAVKPPFNAATERASNDNASNPSCGALSTIAYTAPDDAEVFVRAGCAGSSSCTGVVAVRIERGNQNIALGKPVSQSSFLDPSCGPSSSLVDGNPNGTWCTSSSMLHTNWQAQPFLIIDLGSDQEIRYVDVYNRNDNLCDAACLTRLENYEIWVYSSTTGWTQVAHVPEQAQWPSSIPINARGQLVFLRLRDTNYLNTPEVQVFGPGVGTQPQLGTQPVYERVKLWRDRDGRIERVSSNRTRSSWTYTYSPDHTHQLWSATNANPAFSKTFATDNGNLTIATPTTYGAGAGIRPHAIYRSANETFGYDSLGQRKASSINGAYVWNDAHQLVSFGKVSYAYDASGYRLTKTIGNDTTIYLGDDYEITPQGEHIKYLSLGGRLVAQQTTSGDTTYLMTDHLGSVVLGLDAGGNMVLSNSYGPYGETLSGSDEGRGYTGQRKDENGLIYLHARFYDPQTGRFISPDPAISSEHPMGMNRYAYAQNDPINRTDIDGLGMWDNVEGDVREALRVTTNFLSNINLVDMMQWISNESGHRAPVKKFLGGFNIGVGKSLALIVGKVYAASRSDWRTYGKMLASELTISAAVAASILSYGTAAAPAVAIINAVALPTMLTFIQTQDLDDTKDAALGTIPVVGRMVATDALQPVIQPLMNEVERAFKPLLDAVKKLLPKGGEGGGGGAGAAVGSVFGALMAAEPYILIDARMHATSISPQGRLSSGTGTLFGSE